MTQMSHLQLFEAGARDWTDVMTRTMPFTRQETWRSAGGKEGQAGCEFPKDSFWDPFGIL